MTCKEFVNATTGPDLSLMPASQQASIKRHLDNCGACCNKVRLAAKTRNIKPAGLVRTRCPKCKSEDVFGPSELVNGEVSQANLMCDTCNHVMSVVK